MFETIRRCAPGAILGTVLFLTGSAFAEVPAQGGRDAVPPPPPGGASCWDLNANDACDPAREDRNGDSRCDELDCPPGPREDPNAPPPPPPPGEGPACWDLNANGACDLVQEDHSGDRRCDELDCPPGPAEEEYLRMLLKGAKP